jgi:hypothetical protein
MKSDSPITMASHAFALLLVRAAGVTPWTLTETLRTAVGPWGTVPPASVLDASLGLKVTAKQYPDMWLAALGGHLEVDLPPLPRISLTPPPPEPKALKAASDRRYRAIQASYAAKQTESRSAAAQALERLHQRLAGVATVKLPPDHEPRPPTTMLEVFRRTCAALSASPDIEVFGPSSVPIISGIPIRGVDALLSDAALGQRTRALFNGSTALFQMFGASVTVMFNGRRYVLPGIPVEPLRSRLIENLSRMDDPPAKQDHVPRATTRAQAIRLRKHRQGKTSYEIAEDLGISRQAVEKTLRAHGLSTTTQRERKGGFGSMQDACDACATIRQIFARP